MPLSRFCNNCQLPGRKQHLGYTAVNQAGRNEPLSLHQLYLLQASTKLILSAPSQESAHSSTSSQQEIMFIHISQTHLTCLFPCSSPSGSYGPFLPRCAPNSHLHPDTALIIKQGDWRQLPVSLPIPSQTQLRQQSLVHCSVLRTGQSRQLQRSLTFDKLLLVQAGTWPGDTPELSQKMPWPRRLSQHTGQLHLWANRAATGNLISSLC